ncbi:CBU_0592 family membrane protein [Chitinophaga sp. NPDC101104]|uniref:CBU_0592 family membrane protein n=1 Tax=Chitinophaga sp. NPDC101104 TaxID=3390561 RepID=UPI003D07DC44
MGKFVMLSLALLILCGAFQIGGRGRQQALAAVTAGHGQQAAARSEESVKEGGISWMDIPGWAGTFFYVLGYVLLTMGKIKSDQKIYHWLNALGALGLIANALYLSDYPSFVVNFIWLVIALGAIVWLLLRRRREVRKAR